MVKNEYQQFIFRVFPKGKNNDFIKSEIQLLSYLKSHGINVESFVSNSKGNFFGEIQILDSKRKCAMYNAMSGNIHDELLTNNQSEKLGEITGKLHSAFDQYCGQSDFERFEYDELVWKPWNLIEPYINHNTDLHEFYKETIENCETQLRQSDTILSRGICHGDLHAGNVIFDENDEPGIFDFELCCISWRLYDLATFVWSILPREDYSIESVKTINECIDGFLKGYMRHRTITNEELDLILDMVLLRHIWRQAERLEMDSDNSIWKSEQHFQQQMSRMKKWIEIYD
ncbi:MAG: phosphotransferase [Clostridiales bacterium]|nr:phosphotransferase [Clostridiales bacterium]